MYCPRCGQQLANDIRFCSRCGLPMNVVAEVVANEGVLPDRLSQGAVEKPSPSPHGTRLAVKLIFLSFILLPPCLGLSFWSDSPVPLFAPMMVFLSGLFWLIYTVMFGESPLGSKQPSRLTQAHLESPRGVALPPTRNAVGGFIARAVETGEMLTPPSVTDHTTRLLD